MAVVAETDTKFVLVFKLTPREIGGFLVR